MHISENLIDKISGGFFTGILVGWALKKVIKLVAIILDYSYWIDLSAVSTNSL